MMAACLFFFLFAAYTVLLRKVSGFSSARDIKRRINVFKTKEMASLFLG